MKKYFFKFSLIIIIFSFFIISVPKNVYAISQPYVQGSTPCASWAGFGGWQDCKNDIFPPYSITTYDFPGYAPYQAYSWSYSGHADGHGSFGSAGGRVGLIVCLSPDTAMWSPGGLCWLAIDANGTDKWPGYTDNDCENQMTLTGPMPLNGNLGDNCVDYNLNVNLSIGFQNSIYFYTWIQQVNDSSWNSVVFSVGGRAPSVDSLTSTSYSLGANQSFTVNWTTDSANPDTGVALFRTGGVLQEGDGSGFVSNSGSQTFTCGSGSGTENFDLHATGPTADGLHTVNKVITVNCTGGGASANVYRCSGAGTCIYVGSDGTGTSANSNCDNSCVAPLGPAVTVTASPTGVSSGGSSTIIWTVSGGATSCNATGTGWSGSKSTTGGSQVINNITGPLTFILTCTNSSGTGSDTATVSVGSSSAFTDNATTAFTSAIPDTMTPGQVVTFAIKATNTGNTKWWHGNVYKINKSSGPTVTAVTCNSGLLGTVDYAQICGATDPGGEQNWTFSLTAPTSGSYPSSYTVDMQMLHVAGSGYDYLKPDGTTSPGPGFATYFGQTLTKTFTVAPASAGPYVVNVAAGPTFGGSIKSTSDSKINCGAVCSASYSAGSSVTLKATPASSYWIFAGWAGGCSGTGLCTLNNITSNTTVTAIFNARQFNYKEF